jgi:cytochrome c peroxidase
MSEDEKLQTIIHTFNLKPIDSKEFYLSEKYALGQNLFYDPILSGNRDVSCSTCHLLDYGGADGLPLSIGVGGVGKGPQRVSISGREVHPRNSMDLWNRDHNNVSSMFWDGRVEIRNEISGKFSTPLGERLPAGLENLMAVQSLFPLLTADEMLGYPGDKSASSENAEHNAIPNELADLYAQTGAPILHSDEIFEKLLERLLDFQSDSESASWVPKYRELFEKAYPETADYDISQVANALAHFIEVAFSTRGSEWDRYLNGDEEALSVEAKKGAINFYGKGRCAVCHSGETFSDYEFHSIGVIDTDVRIMESQRDVGRYAVTGRESDKFKFRTPPLRNVVNTSPYFHNGSVSSLFEAVKHHVDPLRNINKYHSSGRFLLEKEQADAISPLLSLKLNLNDSEIGTIVSFLNSISFTHTESQVQKVVPDAVPSGLEFLH